MRNKMRSSYKENNYGGVLRALIMAHLPRLVVECGVLDGYSTYHIAHALRFNDAKRGVSSKFISYDLWENYPFKHGQFKEVATMLRENGLLNKYANLHYGDAFVAAGNWDDNMVDFLHMDISNDGDILKRTLKVWGPKMTRGGIIAFEGGSVERDKVDWMKEYNREPISLVNVTIEKDTEWDIQILTPFPSMTLLFKR